MPLNKVINNSSCYKGKLEGTKTGDPLAAFGFGGPRRSWLWKPMGCDIHSAAFTLSEKPLQIRLVRD